MKITRKTEFTDDRGDGGAGEAARFVGAYGGCVLNSALWKALVRSIRVNTVEGFEGFSDDEREQAYSDALDLLSGKAKMVRP